MPSSDDVERYHGNLESDNIGFDVGSEELSQNPLDRGGPYFDTSVSKNVTILVGGTAYLKFRVRNMGNKTVSIGKFLATETLPKFH